MRHVLGLDHVVIVVRDLAAAEARLARLGFRPTPRGVHSAPMGTANTTVVFADGTYLEALAVLQPTENNAGVRAVLAEREGPYGLAFKTDDADAAAAGFAAAGIGPGAALEFARPVELPSGPGEAAFRVARTDPAHTPGAWLFVCHHRTPEATWRADYLEQPNGAGGIAEVIGVAADPDRMAAAYRRIFGDRLRHDSEGVRIAAGGTVIAFLPPAAFAERLAPFGAAIESVSPRLAALRLRTASPQRTQALLGAQGVRHVATAHGTILVPPDEACGTILEFAASLT
jgi:catechol 2,3-dioxygenase-like lactoylglutathione lyase family enzyme